MNVICGHQLLNAAPTIHTMSASLCDTSGWPRGVGRDGGEVAKMAVGLRPAEMDHPSDAESGGVCAP